MKKQFLILILWISILLSLFLPGLINDSGLMMGGSTSVYTLFRKLKKPSKNSKVPYYYNALGSSAGFARTKNGTFDLGFLSKDAPKNLPKNMKSFILAREGIIFVYHLPSGCKSKKNYFNLTTKELRQIFLEKKAYWSNLSGLTCKNKKQIFRINREAGSGTRTVFEKKASLLKKSKNNLYYFDHLSKHTGDLLKIIKQTPGSFGYMSFSYKNKIQLMKNSNIGIFQIDDVIANKENFTNGDYSFYRNFVGLYLEKNISKLIPFFKFLNSDKAREIFNELGLVYKFDLDEIIN